MSAVNVNPTYNVPLALLCGEHDKDECDRVSTFQELLIHWLNNMLVKLK